MRKLNKKAISLLEYIILIIIIVGAFMVMRGYIQRSLNGNWGKTGQSFSYGRQFDSQKSIDCAFDENSNRWYDRNCYGYYAHHCTDENCRETTMNSTCSVDSVSYCEGITVPPSNSINASP